MSEKKQWFEQQIRTHLDALYGLAYRLCQNTTEAEDIVADSILKAWSGIDSLNDRSRFRGWLFCILRNHYFSLYRKQSVRPKETLYSETESSASEISKLLIEQPDEFLIWWANPERETVNSLLCNDIMVAINDLPEVYQEVIIMVNLEGLSYDETALALEISPGTVRSRMNRGRTLLQKVLWQHAVDEGLISYEVPEKL